MSEPKCWCEWVDIGVGDQRVWEHPECPVHVEPAVYSDEPYPCRIGVFCDDCGTTVSIYITATDAMESPERLEAARAHLRAEDVGVLRPCRPPHLELDPKYT